MTVLTLVVVVCFAYLLLVNLVAVVFLVAGAVENAVRRHEEDSTDYETLGASRFTIPVSVIVAAYNEGPVIEATVSSLLALDYPEHEVVVVNDGSADDTLERLRVAFDLEPYEVFVRHVFPTQPVRGIYRSTRHANLVVVDKENGGKADSWNTALNVARYRYVCGVDADTVFEPTALLQVMRFPMTDPGRVIGVTSQIQTAAEPEKVLAEPVGKRRIDRSLIGVYQHLDFVRAFINNRLAWSRWGFMLCSPGGFQIWRRDVLEEVGGYSTTFTCEDIELTFRIHEKFRREGREYTIHCLPDTVGVTEGPDAVRTLVSQRERWQRVIDETVVHYRRMWFNRRYGSVGMVGAPFYLLTEVLSPFIEVIGFAALIAAVALGVFDWQVFLVVIGAMTFVNAALTAGAVLLDDLQSRLYRIRDLVRILLLTPFDIVLYRPIITWAKLKGSWGFLRRNKSWNKFERNVRAPA